MSLRIGNMLRGFAATYYATFDRRNLWPLGRPEFSLHPNGDSSMGIEKAVYKQGETERSRSSGVAKGARGPSPPILQTKHKHTYKLHKICQFGQFIFEKIIRIVAIRSYILKLKCTKFDFGWGSAPDSAEGAHTPRPFSWILGGPTSKGRKGKEKKGRHRKRKRQKGGREEKERNKRGNGRERKGNEATPIEISGYATV